MGPSATAVPAALLEREHEIERVRVVLRAVGRRSGGSWSSKALPASGSLDCSSRHAPRRPTSACAFSSALASDLEQGYPFGVMRQLFERAMVEADSAERDRWLSGAAALSADVVTPGPTSPGHRGSANER